ncbi:MAG: hypothetical protein Pg6C_19360 [Treponemataceae bacterium]|nr:MAG: hypothetical protein Pg6C_19360 [Treponemataceae bacterium]
MKTLIRGDLRANAGKPVRLIRSGKPLRLTGYGRYAFTRLLRAAGFLYSGNKPDHELLRKGVFTEALYDYQAPGDIYHQRRREVRVTSKGIAFLQKILPNAENRKRT